MKKRGSMSAAEFAGQLNREPAYQAKLAAQADQSARVRAAELALLERLGEMGYQVESLTDLVERYAPLPADLVQALLRHLATEDHPNVQEAVVRALAAARSVPAAPLIALFEGTSSEALRWAVANTLAEARPSEAAAWIQDAVHNEGYGRAREMLLLALARTSPPGRANVALASLLGSFPGHAALGLAESGTSAELPALEAAYGATSGWEHDQIGRTINLIRRREQETRD
ncbi:MAG: hypothetical protein IT431_03550 [Phycisphaerales bacterium]|nr:hypothetical protein [Phycisphaerales bacterium]